MCVICIQSSILDSMPQNNCLRMPIASHSYSFLKASATCTLVCVSCTLVCVEAHKNAAPSIVYRVRALNVVETQVASRRAH